MAKNYKKSAPMTEIRSLARTHSLSAIRTLAKIMTSPDAPPNARVSAAVALLDRGWGRAEQYVNVIKHDAEDYSRAELIAILAAPDEANGGEGIAAEDGCGGEPDKLH